VEKGGQETKKKGTGKPKATKNGRNWQRAVINSPGRKGRKGRRATTSAEKKKV